MFQESRPRVSVSTGGALANSLPSRFLSLCGHGPIILYVYACSVWCAVQVLSWGYGVLLSPLLLTRGLDKIRGRDEVRTPK
jgi:hypothetical protein